MDIKIKQIYLFIKAHTLENIINDDIHKILYVADKLRLSSYGSFVIRGSRYIAGHSGPINMNLVSFLKEIPDNFDHKKPVDFEELSVADFVCLNTACSMYWSYLDQTENKSVDKFSEISNDIAYNNAFYSDDDRMSIEDIAEAACPEQYESLIKHLYENGY